MKKVSLAFIFSSILSVLVLLSVCLFWRNSLLLTGLLIIISAVMIGMGKNKEDFYLYIVIFFIGATAEAIGVASGAWSYTLPDIIGIPFWLPFVWGNAGIMSKRIYLEIHCLRPNS